MSITDQFLQYAEEAILPGSYAKPGEDVQRQLELARTWTRAALQARRSIDHDSPSAGARL
ncbi:MAG: hypothetical protein WCD69_15150 [Xanthobacteraceae bacterium]